MNTNRLVLAIASLLSATSAWAIPPYNLVLRSAVVQEGSAAAGKLASLKCNVCHDPKAKALRNDFGKAVAKHLDRADFVGETKKFPSPKDPAAEKAIEAGLQKALDEPFQPGVSFRDLFDKAEFPFAGG